MALRAAFAGRFAGALAKACSWLYSYSCERLARFARGLFARLTGVLPDRTYFGRLNLLFMLPKCPCDTLGFVRRLNLRLFFCFCVRFCFFVVVFIFCFQLNPLGI